MASWNELQTEIAAHYRVVQEENDDVVVAILVGGARHMVHLRPAETDGDDETVAIWTVIGRETRFSLRAALRYNLGARLGAVVIDGDNLVLRTTLPLTQIDGALVRRAIDYTVAEAVRLTQSGELDCEPAEMFGHLAE